LAPFSPKIIASFIIASLLDDSHSSDCGQMEFQYSLICIFMIPKDAENFSCISWPFVLF
jgi:hypothetical protein